MQCTIVYEGTLCILFSCVEEAGRNPEIPTVLLGIVQKALLEEQEKYLQEIWPTMKRVGGYTEKRSEVIPSIVEGRNADHRDIARDVLRGMTEDYSHVTPFDRKLTQEAVKYARYLQFRMYRYNMTFEDFETEANEVFKITKVVLKKLQLDTQQ